MNYETFFQLIKLKRIRNEIEYFSGTFQQNEVIPLLLKCSEIVYDLILHNEIANSAKFVTLFLLPISSYIKTALPLIFKPSIHSVELIEKSKHEILYLAIPNKFAKAKKLLSQGNQIILFICKSNFQLSSLL